MTRLKTLNSSILSLLPTFTLAPLAQTSFLRKGNYCPLESYKSGKYCIPRTNQDGGSETFIQKEGMIYAKGH